MIKNYLTTAWRNITRHKTFAAINVFGPSLGISACLVIFLMTRFELSFDNYHPGKEKIFRVVSDMYSSESGEDHSGSIPAPAQFAIRNEVTDLETVAVFQNYDATVIIQENGLPLKNFVPLYDIKLLAGRNIQACDTIKEFLVNESCAKGLGFTKPEDAVGKIVETIVPPGGVVKRPVVGVIADFHSRPLQEPLMPVVFTTSKEFTRLLNIKLKTRGQHLSHFKTTLSKIEKCWKEIYAYDPFSILFLIKRLGNFMRKKSKLPA